LTGKLAVKQNGSGKWCLDLGETAYVWDEPPNYDTLELVDLAKEAFTVVEDEWQEERPESEPVTIPPDPPADPTSNPEPANDHSLEPNRDEAERHLTALDPTTDRFTFQTFDDNQDRKDGSLAQVKHGTLASLWKWLVQMNNRGAGIFVCVNITDFKGRSAKNIIGVRSHFGDLDGAPLDPVLADDEPKAHIITETSPGRWQVYWRVVNAPLDQFSTVQKAIAAHFNSDPSVNDLPRVMRIAGFTHRKGVPFRSRLVQTSDHDPYEWSEFRKAFDGAEQLDLTQKNGKTKTAPTSTVIPFEIAREFADIPDADLGEGLPETELPPLPFEPIKAGCEWLRTAYETGGKEYSQSQWNLTTLCCVFLENGHELAHQLGNKHPDYTKESTDELWARKNHEHKEKNIGWPSCKAIANSGCTACAQCPHFSNGKSPITLALTVGEIPSFGGLGLLPVEQPQSGEISTKLSENKLPTLLLELGMKLWGPATSNGKEYRFGADLSKVIDPRKGAWFDFTTNEGGFIKDLMKKLETVGAPIEQAPDYNQSDGAALGYSWHLTWHGETDPADTRKALVQDLLPETGVALISGQWGTYKTFIAADLCAAVMTQTPFANKQVMRKGGVLFIACEGQSEVEIRLTAAFRKHGGIGNAPFAWVQRCPRLLDPNASKILAAMVEHAASKMMQDFGLPVVMVIIDTAGKAAGLSKQGELNDDAIAKMIMSRLAEASTQTGALFVGVAHFGKNIETGTKGSSGFEDDADAVLALLGDRGVNGIVPNPILCARKRRSGPNGEEFSFQTEEADVGPEKTLTIRWTAAPTPKAKKKDNPWAAKSLRHLHQALTNALADYGSQQRPYPDGPLVRAVDIELVRTEFHKTYPATGDEAAKKEARKKAFNRAIGTADHKSLIGTRDIGSITFIWFAQENEEGELIPID
jgi:hypothetical protein